jgi:hypothetical protein
MGAAAVTPAAHHHCPRARGWLVHDDHPPRPAACGTYACDVCGPRKARRLGRAIAEWIRSSCVGGARFWTFTMTSRASATPAQHREALQRAWHIFWREIRRCKALTEQQRAVQYVAIRECHKSGYVHIHALFDRYIPRALVQPLWDGICATVLGIRGEPAGFVWAEHVPKGARHVVRYVTKYVTKGAQNFRAHFVRCRAWSRSGNVVLNLQRQRSTGWRFVYDLRAATMPEIAPTAAITTPAAAAIPMDLPPPPLDGYPF